MKGYGQFCPVTKASEVFAQRCTPLILREMLCGARRFGDLLQGLPRMSRAILATRLKELEAVGLIAVDADPKGGDYRLTPAGEGFRPILEALSLWGQTWGQGQVGPEDLDPVQLAWAIRHHADPQDRPARRLVGRLEFTGIARRDAGFRFIWLVIEPRGIDVCAKYPGFEEQVELRADLGVFTRVWLGYLGLAEAKVAIAGKAKDVAAFKRAIGLFDAPKIKSFRYSPLQAIEVPAS